MMGRVVVIDPTRVNNFGTVLDQLLADPANLDLSVLDADMSVHAFVYAPGTPFHANTTATDPGSNHFLPYAMNMNLCPWGDSGSSKPTRFSDVIRPAQVVALADAFGPYSATFPSKNPYSPLARHHHRVNLLFLAGNAQSFDHAYVGCGVGDPGRDDLRWLTGTDSDDGAGKY